MTYLLLGQDAEAKDKKIADLQRTTLPSKESLKFDYEVLDGYKLDQDRLEEALSSLPAISSRRLIVVRQAHKLTEYQQKIILEFIKKKINTVVLVLESDELKSNAVFVKDLQPMSEVIDFSRQTPVNVFDMTRAISLGRTQEALKILEELFSLGDHPLQIMGGLVWFWGKSRGKIPKIRFQKGLLALQETDYNIKRSRLKPEYALELLVVKLCSAE
ncbi:MAG: hypothetical protein WC552_04020 [Candidatus Omnitrophota bacterium]